MSSAASTALGVSVMLVTVIWGIIGLGVLRLDFWPWAAIDLVAILVVGFIVMEFSDRRKI